MNKHHWMIAIIDDMRIYATNYGMDYLIEGLDDVKIIAELEIANTVLEDRQPVLTCFSTLLTTTSTEMH